MPAPADPLVDLSAPCVGDLSRLLKAALKCDRGFTLGPGANGSLGKPTTGSFTYTLNATGGGAGGGSGTSFIAQDPLPDLWSR